MRRALLIAAIAFQVLVLAFLAGKREYIARTGTIVYLRTAPIDPRDLFRGDYVRLRYDISTVPASMASTDILEDQQKGKSGGTVYARLETGEGGLSEVKGLATAKPAAGPFLKGRHTAPWRFGFVSSRAVGVEYGIEAYYVQQGKGRDIELRQGARTTVQTPLEMEVALGGDGTAVIRGHRWSPLGIGLEVTESARPNGSPGRRSAKLRLTLKNRTEGPLAVVDLPGACSFLLEPAAGSNTVQVPEHPLCRGLLPAESDVVVLPPDGEHYTEIDLADPRWQVIQNGGAVETGALPPLERFRLVYRPPDAASAAQLRDAAFLWHGRLPSRAFHGMGAVD